MDRDADSTHDGSMDGSQLGSFAERVPTPDLLSEGPVRFLLVSGKPLEEPVAWRGPIVMNTKEELQVAFQELQRGTFIK